MANNLMFEVGIKEAGNQLTNLETRLKNLVDTYGSLKIKVEVDKLQDFVNALKTIGNGEQLKPLLERIDSLQTSLTKINGSLGNVDLSSLKKQVNSIIELQDKIMQRSDELKAKGVSTLNIKNDTATDRLQLDAKLRTLEKNFGMTIEQAKHYIRTVENAGDSSSKLEGKIEQLVQSISGLTGKSFSVDLGGEFKTWAQEVQNLVAQVKELVTQMEKLHSVQGQEGAQTQQIDAQTQAVIKESEAYKQLAKWQEQAEQFHKRFGRTGLDIIDWHAESYIKSPATFHNGYGEAYNDLDTIRNHVYALKEEATLLNERKALIDKYSSVSDVGQKQRYDQILSVYNEVYDAMQKLKQEEAKPAPQGGLFDAQKFSTLQEAIDKIIKEVNRLQEAFENLGKNNSLSNLSTYINGLAVTLGTLSNSIKLQPLDEQTKRLIEENEQLKQKLIEVGEAARYINVRNGDRTQEKVADIQKIAGATKEAAVEQEGLTNKQIQQYSILQAKIEKIITSLSNLRSSSEGKYYGTQLDEAIKSYTNVLSGTKFGAEFNFGSDHIATLNRNLTLLGQQYANVIKGAKEFNKLIRPVDALDNKLSKLDARKTVDFAGLDTAKLDDAINKIRAIRNELANFAQTGKSAFGNTPKEIMQTMGLEVANREATMAMKTLNQEKAKGASATSQLTAEEQKLAQAISHSSGEMGKQSQVLSDLKTMAMQYLSVWGAQSFVNSIIEIGGQLEMQRMSIGAILQNTAQANDLFNKIKGLALKSPFGVVELDQMTKQLTAYGFKYNELFDMTKRLADISAATGTGVDRLALALGHVRSEAALSGYTLRQFSMGNVPLLQKLSEKLGKTTEQIRKMVRTKDISYEDVVGVLKDLTNKGGMFYNMQDVISQSVKAKFKNVRDAMDIMYGEMAEGAPGDALKEIANSLMELTRNWRDLATVVGSVTTLWGVHRLAVLSFTKVMGTANAQTLASIATFRKKEASILSQAQAYRTLTSVERSAIATSKLYHINERIRLLLGIQLTEKQKTRIFYTRQQMIMDRALALSEKALTAEDIARQVALGKLTKAEAAQIIALADMTAAEKAAALSAVNNVRTFGKFTGIINGAAIAVTKLGMALKSLLFNPQMLFMAGITAAIELWQRNTREMEEAKELSNKIYEHSKEALKNTQTMLEDTGIKVNWKRSRRKDDSDEWYNMLPLSDITSKFGIKESGAFQFVMPQFDVEEAKSTIERWTQYIREYSATPNKMLNQALYDTEGHVASLEEQFEKLGKAVKEVALSQLLLKNFSDAFENAVNATDGGIFDDNVITNIKDYDKAIRGFSNSVASSYKKYSQSIDRGINAAKDQDEAFAKAVEGMGTYAQQYDYLLKNQEKYATAVKTFKDYAFINRDEFNRLTDDSSLIGDTTTDDVKKAEQRMKDDLDIFYTQLKAELQTKGVDINHLTNEQQQALLLGYKDKLSSIQGLSEEEAENLMKLFAKAFNIELDVDDEKFKVKKSEVIRQLEELIGRDWTISLNMSTNFNDVVTEARKQYKKATDYFKNVKPMMLKLGIQFEQGKELTVEQIYNAAKEAGKGITDPKRKKAAEDFARQMLMGYNEATKVYNNATDAAKTGGFSLKDPTKDNKGNKEDKDAKDLRERMRILKEAADAYKYWKKAVGDGSAEAHVNEEFGDVMAKLGYTFKDVKQFRKTIMDEIKKYEDIYNKSGKKRPQLLEAIKEGYKTDAGLNRNQFEETAEEFASKVQIELDGLTRAWEIFNSVRNATGDVELAVRISGADYATGKTRNLADALKEKIQKDFNASGGGIAFDMNLSDKDIEESIKRSMPAASEKQIKGLVDEYKKWRDLQRDVLKSDIDVFSKLAGGASGYYSQLKIINDELQKQIEANNALAASGKISNYEADKANEIASAQAADKEWKISLEYTKLMNNSLAMTRQEIEDGINRSMANLNKLLNANKITAKEYADEMSRIRKIQSDWNKNSFLVNTGRFLRGGQAGMVDYRDQQYKNAAMEYAVAKNKTTELEKQLQISDNLSFADQKRLEGELMAAQKEEEDAKQRLKNAADALGISEKQYQVLSNMSTVLGIITGILNGIGNAAKGLSEMYDALGDDSAANQWSDMADAINGISSVFQPLNNVLQNAMNGNVGGVVSSAISAPVDLFTGPITAFAKLHDKQIKRQIEESQALRDEMKNLSKTIENILGRTLGGVYNYRTEESTKNFNDAVNGYLIDRWKNAGGIFSGKSIDDIVGSDEEKAINKARETGEYFDQQYALLLMQKAQTEEMLRGQEELKDPDDDTIAQYKQDIKDLDDQIKNFSIDMAKALYDIDIKSWAQEFSDAIVSAWEAGEDASEAYAKSVKSTMKKLAKTLLQQKIMEQAFKNSKIEDIIVKMMTSQSGKLDYSNVGELATALQAAGENISNAYTAVLDELYKKGVIDKGESESSNLSSTIKGVTESTADLLASYINAMRLDLSVNRGMIAQYYPQFLQAMTQGSLIANAQLTQLQQIANNTLRNADLARDIYDILHSSQAGTRKLQVKS